MSVDALFVIVKLHEAPPLGEDLKNTSLSQCVFICWEFFFIGETTAVKPVELIVCITVNKACLSRYEHVSISASIFTVHEQDTVREKQLCKYKESPCEHVYTSCPHDVFMFYD